MPKLATFLGIYVYLYYLNGSRHKEPHIHVEYGEFAAVFSIASGQKLAGEFPQRQTRRVSAWIDIYQEVLEERWSRAVHGDSVDPIE